MHPRLQDVLAPTESARAELLAVLETLTPAQWEQRARAGGWTVRQLVGHLATVEDGAIRALFRTFRNARAAGLAQETSTESLAHSLDYARIPDANTKIEAPAMTLAPDETTVDELRARLAKGREGLRTFCAEADGFALGEPTFPHPVLGPISLYQWVLFIGLHELRHLRQLRGILADPA